MWCCDTGDESIVPHGGLNVAVLLTGATGFLGSAIADALVKAGYDVICAVRRPRYASSDALSRRVRDIEADLSTELDAAAWMPRLHGVEVVINAAGIIRETKAQTFERVHTRGPQALFLACVRTGVQRVIQISALGADEKSESRFHRSKFAADEFLLELPVSAAVVQPSLVYGNEGTSARTFMVLASLPLIPRPDDGEQMIQPVHVHDVALAVLALIRSECNGRIALVGPQALTLKAYLAQLREAMQLGRGRYLSVAPKLVASIARMGGWRLGVPDVQTLGMLDRGNTADPSQASALLGHMPRPVSEFIPAHAASSVRLSAQMVWLGMLLRIAIAAVWIVTGLLSFGLYPVRESYALLAAAGIPEQFAPLLLYGAASFDMLMGIGVVVLKRRRWLWIAQMMLIVGYTAIITFRLPEFWMHPFGPVLKNLPLLVAIAIMVQLDRR